MRTPIDVAHLDRCGVLANVTGGWYLILQWAALPAHVRKQARAGGSTRVGDRVVPTLQFHPSRRA